MLCFFVQVVGGVGDVERSEFHMFGRLSDIINYLVQMIYDYPV